MTKKIISDYFCSGKTNIFLGDAILSEPSNPTRPGKLTANFETFDSLPAPLPRFRSTNYNVIDTDYTNYAVVYFCNPLLVFKSEALWILTRDRQPKQSIIDHALKFAGEEVINDGGDGRVVFG